MNDAEDRVNSVQKASTKKVMAKREPSPALKVSKERNPTSTSIQRKNSQPKSSPGEITPGATPVARQRPKQGQLIQKCRSAEPVLQHKLKQSSGSTSVPSIMGRYTKDILKKREASGVVDLKGEGIARPQPLRASSLSAKPSPSRKRESVAEGAKKKSPSRSPIGQVLSQFEETVLSRLSMAVSSITSNLESVSRRLNAANDSFSEVHEDKIKNLFRPLTLHFVSTN